MLFQGSSNKKFSSILPNIEVKKLTWKDKFKRDLYKQNWMYVQSQKKKRNIQQEEQKRAASKCLSKLLQKNSTIFLEDDQQQYLHHGHYSSFIPLKKNQQKLSDQLQNTFPYIEYLIEKDHQQSKANVYSQISTCLRAANQTHNVQQTWKRCLKKFMCDIDVIRAIEIYVEFLKKGSGVLNKYHKIYGNGCSKEVFFHRVCQASKYFKPTTKINKNIKTTVQMNELVSQVTLPKTTKYLFCAICLVYDCNQHNIDEINTQFNYQYVSRKNIISKKEHLKNILTLIRFQRSVQNNIKLIKSHPMLQTEEGQLEQMNNSDFCSTKCYKRLFNKKQEYDQIKNKRRPVLSPLHRSLIKMGIQLFSYEPCLIWSLLVQQTKTVISQAASTCQSVFFYFIEEYNIVNKLQNKLYNSQYQMLMNQTSRTQQETKSPITLSSGFNKKSKKEHLKFDHQDLQNYRIGICYHYFIGHEVFDHNCQKCCCKRRGFCLPECQCPPTCKIMKQGCNCKSGKDECRTKKCPCYNNSQECIPGLCKGCFDSEGINNKKNNCKNAQILKGDTKHIKIGESNIMGLGAFAAQDIAKDELVCVYTGEIIQHQVDYMREGLRFDDTFYNFEFAGGGSIDARFMGNKSRFINHQKGGEQNLVASTMFSEGRFKTVLYSKKNIKKGEQLYFDYDVTGNLVKNFPGKYDFIKKKKQ